MQYDVEARLFEGILKGCYCNVQCSRILLKALVFRIILLGKKDEVGVYI